MKLVSFSVTNYRSITRAHKINLHDLTILVGKNNEGKSNILKAIALSMDIIKKYAIFQGRTFPDFSYDRNRLTYIWERDFPINSQNKDGGSKSSKFELEFSLTNDELIEFNKKINSRLSTNNFSVIIEIGANNMPKFKVSKKGTSKLTKKAREINNFIAENLVFNYIPAIRTESQAIELIRETLAQELKTIEHNEEYIEAINTINRLQREPLAGIAEKVKDTLQIFLPSIDKVKIDIAESTRRLSLRRDIDVLIDDGVLTNIEYKGDGIKSLATLAMLTDRYNVEQSSIIAIDEPEAHLHSGAISQLNKIINGLIQDNQVIISSHNPLFVNKTDIKSNVIVSSGKATPAKNIKEIRDILGVKVSDNLISSNFVLFVEGETDKKIVEKLLMSDAEIKESISNSELSILSLGGASNLSSKLYDSKNKIFEYHVLLDNDKAGNSAYDTAYKNGLIDIKQVTFTNCIGMSESEIEDCIKPEVYLELVNMEYGVNLAVDDFNTMDKWSKKVEKAFLNNGKRWNYELEKKVKNTVADAFVSKFDMGVETINIKRKSSLDSLINCVRNLLNKR